MDEKIVRETSARQGPKGKPVLYVLVAALVLMGIYMVGMMTWSSKQGPDYASQSQGASRSETTGSVNGQSNAPSSANTSGVPAGNPSYPAPAVPNANSGTSSAPKP
jgi:hypothetical protein